MRILVVQHETFGPSGLVGDAILASGGTIEITMPGLGGPLPSDPSDHEGLLILGGPQSAGDDQGNPHYKPLHTLIRAFAAEHKPVMGICLGAQLIARAFGAVVRPLGRPEIGFTKMRLTEAGKSDPLLQGLPDEPVIMQFHDDTFDLPDGAELLITGEACANQAFRLGETVYAFQCHHEVTEAIARNWATIPQAASAYGSENPVAKMDAELVKHYDGSKKFATVVTERWLTSSKKKRVTPAQAAE